MCRFRQKVTHRAHRPQAGRRAGGRQVVGVSSVAKLGTATNVILISFIHGSTTVFLNTTLFCSAVVKSSQVRSASLHCHPALVTPVDLLTFAHEIEHNSSETIRILLLEEQRHFSLYRDKCKVTNTHLWRSLYSLATDPSGGRLTASNIGQMHG